MVPDASRVIDSALVSVVEGCSLCCCSASSLTSGSLIKDELCLAVPRTLDYTIKCRA